MPLDIFVNLLPWMMGLVLGTMFFTAWSRERRFDREIRRRQLEQEEVRIKEEAERLERAREDERYERYVREKREEEAAVRAQAGAGSGGYIVLDLPNTQRSLFHDLLKGFEEYARLKGYGVSFSVDSTFNDRIAFKFTLTDPDVVVGNERVRKDLKEYLDKVSQGDSLEGLPTVVSIEEHELLVSTLRNRISFLQHNYNLAKNSAEFYEGLIRRASAQPFLPAPNIVVQTGGAYNAPSYAALNSPQALLGNANVGDHSVRIAITYKERKAQVDQLAKVLHLLRAEAAGQDRDEMARNIANVKDEIEQSDSPETSRVANWLQRAKDAMQFGSLGHETVQAAKELFRIFGIG